MVRVPPNSITLSLQCYGVAVTKGDDAGYNTLLAAVGMCITAIKTMHGEVVHPMKYTVFAMC